MEITRRFEFDAGHRVLGHEGKCASLHGHRYAAEVTVACPELDQLSRVVDFGVMKEKIGRMIDNEFDHRMILHPDDPLRRACIPSSSVFGPKDAGEIIGPRGTYVMPHGSYANPTAESIGTVLFGKIGLLLADELETLTLKRVRLYETPNCWADITSWAELEDHLR